mmetsp:Transcript_15204/g.40809  ORF Transcript_15204/g.40809 Transcript_15204/m.40809 type:complete len:210 (+) Transcript_15204:709-1338(+)
MGVHLQPQRDGGPHAPLRSRGGRVRSPHLCGGPRGHALHLRRARRGPQAQQPRLRGERAQRRCVPHRLPVHSPLRRLHRVLALDAPAGSPRRFCGDGRRVHSVRRGRGHRAGPHAQGTGHGPPWKAARHGARHILGHVLLLLRGRRGAAPLRHRGVSLCGNHHAPLRPAQHEPAGAPARRAPLQGAQRGRRHCRFSARGPGGGGVHGRL